MRRIITCASVAILLLLSLPAAHAKGPVAVTISGDGVKAPIEVNLISDPSVADPINSLMDSLAVFDLIFGESKRVLTEQPSKALGDVVVTLDWDLHGGEAIISQHIYLDAAGGPVTHVPAGQPLWEDFVSAGGWMTVTRDIAAPLTELGVDAAVFGKSTIDKTSVTKSPQDKAPQDKAPQEETTKDEVEKKVLEQKTPEPAAPAAAPAADVAPAAVPAEDSSSGGGLLPVLALVALAGIIGAAAWVRVRPAAQ